MLHKNLKTPFLSLAAAVAIGAWTIPAHATLIQTFNVQSTASFDQIEAQILQGTFAEPGFDGLGAGWTTAYDSSALTASSGTLVNDLTFSITFAETDAISFAFKSYNNAILVEHANLSWTASSGWTIEQFAGNSIGVPIPEPSTIVAALLLLIPLGLGITRSLRKSQA